MKRKSFIFSLGISLCLLSSLSFAGQGDFGIVQAKGRVNTSEIGGQGQYVFSLWNSGRKALIGSDGSFTVAILSNARPQKLSVRDASGKTRALAFVLSQEPKDIVFDAASTAMVVLFNDPSLIKSAQEMKHYLAVTAKARSFQDLVSFLKTKLPQEALEDLIPDETYVTLFEKCNQELFDVDRASIKKSLHKAQGELEKSLYGP